MSESGATPKKVKKVEGPSSFGGDGRDYDAETQKALQEIDSCQNKIDALNVKSSEAILKVEQRYNKQRKPHFDKRNDIIKTIPNFWATVFVNHPQISTILGEDEEDCLHYLSKLDVEEFEDIKSGYIITFHFDENPYFENDVITKEFHLGASCDPFSISTPIRWKEGNDVAKKIRNKNVGKGRKVEQKSFFLWLASNCNPYTDCIAEVIKDDMWVNPLQYYLVPDEVGNECEREDVTTDEEVDHSLLAKDEVEEEEDIEGEGGDDEVLVEEEEEEEEGKELGEDDVDGHDK